MIRLAALGIVIALSSGTLYAQSNTDRTPTGSIRATSPLDAFSIINDTLSPKLSTYVQTKPVTNFTWTSGTVQQGAVVPYSGPVYNVVPAQYDVDKKLRLSRINNQHVLVDPATRRIVEIVR